MSPKQGKPVKREVKQEEDEEDNTPLSSSLKSMKKSIQMNGSREARLKAAAKIKKEEPQSDEDDDAYEEKKPIIKKTPKKVEKGLGLKDKKMIKKEKVKEEVDMLVRKKKVGSVAAAVGVKEKKKEKKVYDLPGQKHDPPEERDPLRIFYETLFQQLPSSEMAAFWMMEWGLLPPAEAKKVYELKLKKNQQLKFSSPVKTVSVKKTTKEASVKKIPVKSTPVSKTASKTSKKRKANNSSSDEGEDDDFTPIKKKTKKQKGAT
ncbi:hypothetical protein AAC387_Pa07g3575 [Persea americana]